MDIRTRCHLATRSPGRVPKIAAGRLGLLERHQSLTASSHRTLGGALKNRPEEQRFAVTVGPPRLIRSQYNALVPLRIWRSPERSMPCAMRSRRCPEHLPQSNDGLLPALFHNIGSSRAGLRDGQLLPGPFVACFSYPLTADLHYLFRSPCRRCFCYLSLSLSPSLCVSWMRSFASVLRSATSSLILLCPLIGTHCFAY